MHANNAEYSAHYTTATSTLVWQRWLLCAIFCLLCVLIILSCALGSSPLLPVTLLIAAIVCLWAIRQPQVAVLFVFAGAGLPSLLLPVPGHTMRPIELALLLCLLVVLLRRPSFRWRLAHLLALLFLAIAFISFIHVPQIATALNAYGANKRLYDLILPVLALFCGTWLATHVHIKRASAFLSGVLLVHIPLYLIMLTQAVGIMLPSLLEDSSAQNPTQTLGRLWGPFDGAVTLGLYLTNLFAIALSCWLLGTRRRERCLGAVITIASVLGIVGSGTRSAALAVGLILVIALLMTRHLCWLLLITAVVGLAILLFPAPLLAHFAHDVSSTNNRLFLWQTALNLIRSHPWIGIGLQQFPAYYAQLIVSQGTQLNPQGISVHNQYLELALESGVFWLLSGVLLLFSMFYACWKAYWKATSEQQVLLLAALLACSATILTGFFDVPLDKAEGAVFMFLLAGLALGTGWQKEMHLSGIWETSRWWHKPDLTRKKNIHTSGRDRFTASIETLPPTASRPPGGRGEAVPAPNLHSNDTHKAAQSSKTGRSVLVQLLSWGVGVPIIFPTTALLAHYLGPVRYGEYSATLPFLAVFALLTCTGMDAVLVRRLSHQSRSIWRETLSYAAGTRLLSTLLSVGAAIIAALLLPASAEQRQLFLLSSVALFFSYSFNGLRTIYEHGFRAEEHITPVSLLETCNRIVTALLIVVAVLAHWPFVLIYVLMIYSDLPFCLCLMALAQRRYGVRLRFNWSYARMLLRESLPLNGYNVMTLLSGQADLLLLMLLTNARSVGWYALASRITDPLLAPMLAYVGGLYPLLCKTFAIGRERLAQVYLEAVRVLALLVIPLVLLLASQAHVLINLLGGTQFAPATPIVQLLFWTVAITFFNQLAVRTCIAIHAEKYVTLVTVIAACTNLLLNLLLIPFWQGIGAAIAALLSECIAFCLLLWLLRSYIHPTRVVSMLCFVGAGNLPALAFLLWQPHLPLWLVIPITLCLTLSSYLFTGSLTKHDLIFVGRLASVGAGLPHPRLDTDVLEPHGRGEPAPAEAFSEQATIILPRMHI